ncbi:MAG: response regulator [bacterium]|nr:response regulator [bacterium]
MNDKKILIIEEEAIIALEIRNKLEDCFGYRLFAMARSGWQAIKIAKEFRPDLLLSEIILPGELDGISTVEKIREILYVPVIFVTSNEYLKADKRVQALKPIAVLGKPFDEQHLLNAVKDAFSVSK